MVSLASMARFDPNRKDVMTFRTRTAISVGAASVMSVSALAAAPAQAASSPDRVAARAGVSQSAAPKADLNDICTLIGLGSGAAGITKALAKGASWVGIGASAGCWLLNEGEKMTPAERRAVVRQAYADWEAKSAVEQLEEFGLSCRLDDGGGGGGGTDRAMAGVAYYTVDGKKYRCTGVRD